MNGLSFSSFPIIHAWRGSIVSTKVDTYQEPRATQSAGPDRSRETVEGGVGPLAGVSAAWMPRPSPQGRVYGVPRQRTHPAFDSFPRSVGAGALRCSW
ncbi:hypothetical protein EGI91_18880, partial [Stenotrophomonas maltophilia]